MGSCVSSAHKESKSTPTATVGFRLPFGTSKADKLVIPSPVKDKSDPLVNDNSRHRTIADVGLKSHWSPPRSLTNFRDFGTKEETFFDSNVWLESDCEDDFYSVNGDFTPSRGSTPVHHGVIETPKINGTFFENRAANFKSEPSPTLQKKKLLELFKERLQADQDVDEQNMPGNLNGADNKAETTSLDLPPKSTNETPYVSGANSMCSGEGSPNREVKPAQKSIRSAQCCLPRLLSNRSFSERKKKLSPIRSIG